MGSVSLGCTRHFDSLLFRGCFWCIQVRQSGGVDRVLQLLIGSQPRTQRAVLVALATLTARNDVSKAYVVDCGGLEMLVEVRHTHTVQHAASRGQHCNIIMHYCIITAHVKVVPVPAQPDVHVTCVVT